ncbi:MAG: hypothetical protein SWH68_03965 [Thermodesulfobacteriota bacterium]|nr:hypothetical protein [Thermodesulfobacteriota bacterium]
MIIDMGDFEIDLDALTDAFSRLYKDLGIDEADGRRVYNIVSVYMASVLAAGLLDDHGDAPEMLEAQLQETCQMIADDMAEKIRAFCYEDAGDDTDAAL